MENLGLTKGGIKMLKGRGLDLDGSPEGKWFKMCPVMTSQFFLL
jgi:hypothetical protein